MKLTHNKVIIADKTSYCIFQKHKHRKYMHVCLKEKSYCMSGRDCENNT